MSPDLIALSSLIGLLILLIGGAAYLLHKRDNPPKIKRGPFVDWRDGRG